MAKRLGDMAGTRVLCGRCSEPATLRMGRSLEDDGSYVGWFQCPNWHVFGSVTLSADEVKLDPPLGPSRPLDTHAWM